MSVHPNDRYANAEELADALRAYRISSKRDEMLDAAEKALRQSTSAVAITEMDRRQILVSLIEIVALIDQANQLITSDRGTELLDQAHQQLILQAVAQGDLDIASAYAERLPSTGFERVLRKLEQAKQKRTAQEEALRRNKQAHSLFCSVGAAGDHSGEHLALPRTKPNGSAT